jgi:DNA processing protein
MEEPTVLDPADPRPEVREGLRDWLALQLALALRPREAGKRLRASGSARKALAASGLGPPAAASLDSALAGLRDCGAVALPQLSPAFPARLARLDDAPLLLHVRGEVAALHGPCVAVVGSRAPSASGRVVAEHFAAALARAGAVIVSGLATGIDGVAHRAALAVGGRTIAVQACGPDLVYPRRHRELADEIAASGAVVTELPPGTPPRREHFPFRNRLISALSSAVLVVEARMRSGSLVTARHAADQGVDVWAVPGPLGAPTSEGTNRLLRDGAFVALEPADLLLPLGLPSPEARRRRSEPALAGPHRAILGALQAAPATLDELGLRLGSAPEILAQGVLELELLGVIAQDRDGRLCIVRPERGGL